MKHGFLIVFLRQKGGLTATSKTLLFPAGDSMDQQHQQGLGACEKWRSQASPRPPESGSSSGQNPTFSSEKHCLSSNFLIFSNLTAFIQFQVKLHEFITAKII